MRSLKVLFSLSLLSSALMMSGCGRSGSSLNQSTLPLANGANGNLAGGSSFQAPIAQTPTTGTAEAMAGGRAVATAGGYVYENAPSVGDNAYNYYNQQNPCLFPQPGQAQNCQGGTQDYYGGNRPQQSTGAYPQYPNQNNFAGGYPQQTGTYPQQAGSYPQQVGTYPQQNGTFAQGYPQNNLPQNNYGQNTYAQSNQYSTYRAPVSTPQTRAPQASVPQTSAVAASKAQARINPNAGSGSRSSGGNSNKKISF